MHLLEATVSTIPMVSISHAISRGGKLSVEPSIRISAIGKRCIAVRSCWARSTWTAFINGAQPASASLIRITLSTPCKSWHSCIANKDPTYSTSSPAVTPCHSRLVVILPSRPQATIRSNHASSVVTFSPMPWLVTFLRR